MTCVLNQNISKLRDFCQSKQDQFVLKTGLNEFKSVIGNIIFSASVINQTHPFFNSCTMRSRVSFQEFLDLPHVSDLLNRIYQIDDELNANVSSYLSSIDSILNKGQSMDPVLLQNYGDILKKEMLDHTVSSTKLERNHNYLYSRLTPESKTELISLNKDFIDHLNDTKADLESLLKLD